MKALAEAAIRISEKHTHKHAYERTRTHTHTAPAMLSYHALATPTDCSISPSVSPRLPAVARDTVGAACENVENGCGLSPVCRRSQPRVKNSTIKRHNLMLHKGLKTVQLL